MAKCLNCGTHVTWKHYDKGENYQSFYCPSCGDVSVTFNSGLLLVLILIAFPVGIFMCDFLGFDPIFKFAWFVLILVLFYLWYRFGAIFYKKK